MKNHQIIRNLKEPTILYLMWQDLERNRHHVANLYKNRLEYLDVNLPDYFEGFPAFPNFRNKKKVYEGNILSMFISRCPPRERVGYDSYLKGFGLDPEQKEVKEMSDFMLIGYTGAYLPSDSFHVINPFIDINPPFEFVMKIAGVNDNEYKGGSFEEIKNKEGESLSLELEPSNLVDKEAIKINFQGKHLGYVQRGFTNSFHNWLNADYQVKLSIYRLNGSSKRRYAYAFVRIFMI